MFNQYASNPWATGFYAGTPGSAFGQAIDPSTGKPYVLSNGNNFGWEIGPDSVDMGRTSGSDGAMVVRGTPGAALNDPAFLKSIGYTGSGMPTPVGSGEDFQGMQQDPGVQQYLDQMGYTVGQRMGDADNGDPFSYTQVFDKDGNPVGIQHKESQDEDPGNLFLAAVLGAGGFGASAALGAGAAVGGAGEAGGGLSSSDLAALYGNTGYTGAADGGLATADAGGLAGTGLPEYSGYAGPGYSVAGDNAVAPSGFFNSPSYDDFGTDLAGSGGAGTSLSTGSGGISNGLSGATMGSGNLSGAAGSNSWLNSLGSNFGFDNLGDTTGISNSSLLRSGLSLAGTVGQGLISSNAASNALNAQTNATNSANALQKYMFDQNNANWAPYRQAGTQALGNMQNLLNNPSSVLQDPGVAFQMQQGQTALNRQAAAAGGMYSGAQLKAADRYNQDYASTALDKALARYGNVAQLGATGTQGTQAAGANYANTVGSNTTALGNAAAGSNLYTAGVINNGISQLVGNGLSGGNGINYNGDGSLNYNGSTYVKRGP